MSSRSKAKNHQAARVDRIGKRPQCSFSTAAVPASLTLTDFSVFRTAIRHSRLTRATRPTQPSASTSRTITGRRAKVNPFRSTETRYPALITTVSTHQMRFAALVVSRFQRLLRLSFLISESAHANGHGCLQVIIIRFVADRGPAVGER